MISYVYGIPLLKWILKNVPIDILKKLIKITEVKMTKFHKKKCLIIFWKRKNNITFKFVTISLDYL